MPDQSIVLSIIIVTYNSQELIVDCLDSIYKYNDLDTRLEIILVDNSPIESFVALSKIINSRYRDVKIVKSDKNGGYGYGNNLGVLAAKGRHILILNPDTRLNMPLFKDAVIRLEGENTSIVGVKLVYEDNSPQLSFFFRPEYQNILTKSLTLFLNKFDIFYDKYMITSGSCMFMQKDNFIEIGMFDERMFLGNEESFIAKKFKLIDQRNRFIFMNKHTIIHLYKDNVCSVELRKNLYNSHLFYFNFFKIPYRIYYYNILISYYVKYSLKFIKRDSKNMSLLFDEIQTIKSVFNS